MDIERYKRLATAKVKAGRATKVVRDTLKDVEYSKQDQYEERGEMFKPVIDSQMEVKKAVDKKQDELIKQLREGQDEIVKAIEYDPKKAITYEGKKLPKLDYDVGDDDDYEHIVEIDDEKPSTSKPTPKVINLDKGINDDYKQFLDEKGLPMPSELVGSDKINSWVKKVDGKIARSEAYIHEHSTKTGKPLKDLSKIQKSTLERNKIQRTYLKDYLSRLIHVKAAPQYMGTGILSQRKRNAYKIGQGGSYGNLTIDLPKLMGQLKLVAHKNGSKVYDKVVDFDTIDLPTKRFNSRKNYSNLSKRVFEDLNSLSEIPIHKTSKKYQKIGSGVKFFSDSNDLMTRMELLVGEMKAGNDSTDVRDEFVEIIHVLHKLGLIDVGQLNSLLEEYVI